MSRSVVVLLVLTAAAVAGSPEPGELARQIRTGSPRARRSAAVQLAAQVTERRSGADDLAARAILGDDAQVRAPLLASLVDTGALPRTAAARVPTRSQLGARLRRLGRGFTPEDCIVALRPDRDDAELRCSHLVEARCLFDTIDSTTVTIGARWVIAPVQRTQEPNNLCDF